MKYDAKFSEKMQMIKDLMKLGHVKAESLAAKIGVSKRTVYRYLEQGCELGTFYSPVRGYYYPSEINAPSPEQFVKFNSSNVDVSLSQNKQHNKTQHSKRNFPISEFESFKTHNVIGYKQRETEHTDANVSSQNVPLVDLVVRILELAGIPYGKRDLNYALNSLGSSAWWMVTDENIQDYTAESVKRMLERIERDPNVIKTNAVGYFFGIFSNVLSADTRHITRIWKRDFLPAYIQMAAGAEEVTVTLNQEQRCDSVTTAPVPTSDTCSQRGANASVIVPEVPEKWRRAQELLNQMVLDLTTYGVIRMQLPITRLLQHLDEQEVRESNVEAALEDVMTHDKVAAGYLIRKVHSNLFSEAQRQLDRHFERAINRHLKLSTNEMQPISNEKLKTRDERYAAFYQLFPDS